MTKLPQREEYETNSAKYPSKCALRVCVTNRGISFRRLYESNVKDTHVLKNVVGDVNDSVDLK